MVYPSLKSVMQRNTSTRARVHPQGRTTTVTKLRDDCPQPPPGTSSADEALPGHGGAPARIGPEGTGETNAASPVLARTL